MGEKRKADYVILLKNRGKSKSSKVELFSCETMGEMYFDKRDRLRVNGKWWPEGERKFFNKTQVKEMVFRSIKID